MSRHTHLGQHFLIDINSIETLASALSLPPTTPILEIGPGRGSLTRALLKKYHTVHAIEKDPSLVAYLQDHFSTHIKNGSLKLHNFDIRDINAHIHVIPEGYAVIANIPYYITGSILTDFLTQEKKPTAMTLLMQNEVALRITNKKKSSILSLAVSLYGTPHYISLVSHTSFAPPPKVESAIITITDIRNVPKNISTAFFAIVHAAFAHKRQYMLKHIKHAGIQEICMMHGITNTTRAEDVPFETWLAIAKKI
ncbi:MAG: 16S rRNA (adenine(1518)-N(6)/adenine(1519)-N(6))-dimethyltransferase RsmA [Alphaproteobacteria bacterium]|nr:16S rRNA (adenine(1518)-N(6)/adenine(1519)-N(6))-dimethyltransferase RsmA [Alphaproteobacteria bacterium]